MEPCNFISLPTTLAEDSFTDNSIFNSLSASALDSLQNSMQKDDDIDNQLQQQHNYLTSDDIAEYPTATLMFNDAPYTSTSSSSGAPNFNDIARVLSLVELPSPSPELAPAPCGLIGFHEGQPSGTKKENDEREEKLKTQRGAEQRRRNRILERIRALKELVPGCNKRDQASILDDAISYIGYLQMHVQMMQFTGAGTMPHGPYMFPWRHPSLQEPYLAPYLTMRPMNEAGCSIGQYGSYFTPTSPVFPPFVGCFGPAVPPIQVGTGSPRLLPIPYPQRPSQTSEPGSQVGYGISSQYPYHMPVKSKEK